MGLAGYDCDGCGGAFGPEEATYRCPSCGGNLFVRVDVRGDLSQGAIEESADPSMWRWASLLPVAVPSPGTGVLLSVGGTPLYPAGRAAERLGLGRVAIKEEARMPTGSLKDRASALVVARALEIGAKTVITASTGNAGVALAAMARAAGIHAVIVVPESAPPAKVAQLQVFGAQLALVKGSYDDAFELTTRAAAEFGWYCRNTGMNPFTVEGKKTVVFEIAQQLGWLMPEWIAVPVGDGNILVSVHKGLRELLAAGLIDAVPRLLGVQAVGSSPIAQAFDAGADTVVPVVADTVADSIAAGNPSDGVRALRAVRETGGAFVTVTDAQILDAIVDLGRDAAVFAEPAAAAAYAGLAVATDEGVIGRGADVTLLVTGTGLKDVRSAVHGIAGRASSPPVIEPTLDALEGALNARGPKV